MNALASHYLGLDLAHPIIASASPLVEGLQRWLADHAFESVSEIRGHLDGTRAEPIDALMRRQYARWLGAGRLSLSRKSSSCGRLTKHSPSNGARSGR